MAVKEVSEIGGCKVIKGFGAEEELVADVVVYRMGLMWSLGRLQVSLLGFSQTYTAIYPNGQ